MTDQKLRILVVDDSRFIRKAFHKILDETYDLVEASDGQEAWDLLLEDDTICAIFTDKEMPILNGIELLQRVRSADNSCIQSLPVVLVTASEDDDEDVQKSFEYGITDIVRKPFDSLLLKARARTHVKARAIKVADANENTAIIDPTTQLANKSYFYDRGVKDIAFAERQGHQVAVAILGIDNYSALVKKFGSDIESLSVKIGGYMRPLIHPEDTLGHLGGGTFGLIIVSSGPSEMESVFDGIRSLIKERELTFNGNVIESSISIGVCEWNAKEGQTFEELVNSASRYLKTAQAMGGDRCESAPKKQASLNPDLFSFATTALERVFMAIYKNQAVFKAVHAEKVLHKIIPMISLCGKAMGRDFEPIVSALRSQLSGD